MKSLLKVVLLLGVLISSAMADMGLPNLDRTDKIHSRRYLDSINVYNRRPIRLNQSGFRPQDYKYAYVADAKVKNFSVINANTGAEAWSGTLTKLSGVKPIFDAKDTNKVIGYEPTEKIVKPPMYVNGAFNSITQVYKFGEINDKPTETEDLYKADFTGLNPSIPGEYFVVVGKDTSATFHIHPSIFNSILENALKFFGIQRCGNTKSHFHAQCHMKDGSRIGHDLTGGWHDCGDHYKVGETIGYTAYVLSMVYLAYQDKAEDRYGESYADTVFTDGIPDVLYEAKIGTDYILKLYNASVEDGLLEKGDMYHTVGMSDFDHAYWDLPERQDQQTQAKGGPDRLVLKGIGTNVAGVFAAALANVAAGYKVYDPEYSETLLNAAKDIYKRIVKPTFINFSNETSGELGCARKGKATTYKTEEGDPIQFNGKGYYSGMGLCEDDAAAAATSLWYATGDTMYKYDLFNNQELNKLNGSAQYDLAFFEAGYLGTGPGFNNSWATDYQNLFSYVLFSIQKLILNSPDVTTKYNISEAEREKLTKRVMAGFRKQIQTNTSGDFTAVEYPGSEGDPRESPTQVHVETPYNLVWSSFDWGVIRYNMGSAVAVFLLYELMHDERYLRVSLDNMYYALGANPWDISFLMGAGDKNPQHPHNRTANPDGYNAGGMPYEYRCPLGALMGGRMPTRTLIEDWNLYTSTETCIDFSAQLLFPAQSLAQSLPEDNEGPLFSNIAGTPISATEAVISWDANEVALVTVFYGTTTDPTKAKSVTQTKATKGGSVTIDGLTVGQTYYFFLEGMDTKRNLTTDDNHGQWYQFTMTDASTTISDVTICQVDNRSAKIYWWTSDRVNGMVNFGTAPGVFTESQTSTDGAVLFHEVKLTGLEAGTTYYFSVSSGSTTDKNGGTGYSFTTESHATYANLATYIKPTSTQAACSSWESCREFVVSISNHDTIPFEDFEVRLYLNAQNLAAVSNVKLNFCGSGVECGHAKEIIFGSAQPDGKGNYYLPIQVNSYLEVSGQIIFEVLFNTTTYKDLDGSWSLRPHTDESDPVRFEGVNLAYGPHFTKNINEFVEEYNGSRVEAFTKDPYIAVYYHGKHIYGYGPEDTWESGPQQNRVVTLNFTEPFVSPIYSVEKVNDTTSYQGNFAVTPTGFLDDFQMNGKTQGFMPYPPNRSDSAIFLKDTVLAYGNNYMEWVAWHNHGANKKTENKYDCACGVVRTLVEIDSIVIPQEKRYLVFDKRTYNAYTGKLAEVRVKLLDSLGMKLDTVNVTVNLGTGNDLSYFYSTPTASIPITSITLENGEAVFYVSSETPATTTVFARASNTASHKYEEAISELIIEELPPWPIIDVAKMVDTDCDNIPDALQITTTDVYQPNQSFNSVKFSYGKDTLKTSTVISHEGKELVVALNLKDPVINTNPTGSVTLISTVDGIARSHDDFYQDGVSPTLLSISVLERLDTATSDHVYLQFSEPISAPGENWPTRLFASNQSAESATPDVKFTKLDNDSLNIWEFEIGFAADGSSLVKEGMFAQLLNTSDIKDLNDNSIAFQCGQPKLPILLKLIPIPMSYAAISDADEDGLAEHLYVEFERPMDNRHIPDSISAIFGRTEPETLWVSGTDISIVEGSTSATINLKTPFSLGNTSGNYSGSSKGLTVEGAGLVAEHLGSGASYTTTSTLMEDMVGPVIISADIKGSTRNVQFLLISLSEPISVRDQALVLYRQKQGSKDTAIFKANLSTWEVGANGVLMTSGYDTQSDLSVTDGDFVRLQPKEMSALHDIRGNLPSVNAPWVPISGSGKPKVKIKVNLAQNVSSSGGDKKAVAIGNKNIRYYIQNPSTKKLDLIVNGKTVATGLDSAALTGAVWKVELSVPRGATAAETPAWDSLRVRYNIPIYSNLGSYVNRVYGVFKVLPNQYLSSSGKVVFYTEWANMPLTGIQTEDGRSVGTGAYIYKAQFDYRFYPNKTKDQETIKRFDSGDSYNKTETFGIKRVK